MTDEQPDGQPTIVFLKRYAAKEGETSIVQISEACFTLFKAQLALLRELADGGTSVPIAAATDSAGQEIGAVALIKLMPAGTRSPQALMNFYSRHLRAELNAQRYSLGVIVAHAFLDADGAWPTEDLSQANGIVAWVAEPGRVVQIRYPNEGGDIGGERVIGLPIYSAQQVLAEYPAPAAEMGPILACGFEADELGTWATFENDVTLRRDRNGDDMQTSDDPVSWDAPTRIDSLAGQIWITVNGQEFEMFKAPAPLLAAAVLPDAQFALTAHRGQIIFWDLYMGHAAQVMPVQGSQTAVAFSRHATLAALGGSDGTLTIVRLMPD